MTKLTTPEELHRLFSAATGAAALGAAIETGLLWLLDSQPMDADDVARTLSIPRRRCQYWLQYLEALGILEEDDSGYAPSALTRAAILDTRSRQSWQQLALDERERAAGSHHMALHLSAPGSVWAAQGLPRPQDYVEKMRGNPERAREFTRMLFEVHQRMAGEIATLLDLDGVSRVLDLGGGSGVVAMALLRRHPHLTATVIDLETVCAAGREIAAEQGFAERITYHAADFVRDALPGGFDLALQCDVGVFAEGLAAKLWAALNPGGRLLMAEHFSPADDRVHPARLRWSLLDSLDDPDFHIPTAAQARAQLAQAGFRLLPGEHTLACGRVVIQVLK